jgi:hypothetical protein
MPKKMDKTTLLDQPLAPARKFHAALSAAMLVPKSEVEESMERELAANGGIGKRGPKKKEA